MMNFNECPFFPSLSLTRFRSVDVCYMTTDGATIKSISENVVVNPGDEAKLSCAVDGKFVRGSFFVFYDFSLYYYCQRR
jgi:hypothetical protein